MPRNQSSNQSINEDHFVGTVPSPRSRPRIPGLGQQDTQFEALCIRLHPYDIFGYLQYYCNKIRILYSVSHRLHGSYQWAIKPPVAKECSKLKERRYRTQLAKRSARPN